MLIHDSTPATSKSLQEHKGKMISRRSIPGSAGVFVWVHQNGCCSLVCEHLVHGFVNKSGACSRFCEQPMIVLQQVLGQNEAEAVPWGTNKRTSTVFNTDGESGIKTIPWTNNDVMLSSPFCLSNQCLCLFLFPCFFRSHPTQSKGFYRLCRCNQNTRN